ncbi:aminotransferase [Candidatus Epulonipiscium fishelsonii]|uniref:Aminotransferase n=1 Tax=Candidatus Epulonipiscium fishelsonii TaxID=77094 RepID=A0ACC8X8T7_9FIRM|nr:aminotransferase [Epulopiscium sp. SCG-D08WGA-EpuloA1]
MMYNFTAVVDRKNTGAMKTDTQAIKEMLNLNCNFYDDTIFMWVADMDFACSKEIINAFHERTDKLIFGYTTQTKDYYDSIINWYGKRHNMKIEEDWITFSPGTVSAIRNCLRAFTSEGDGVIIQPPVYYPFEEQILETNRTILRNELVRDENNHYSIDFEDFEEKCKDPNAKMFIYCNPHNPIGQIWSKDDTSRLLEICEKNNVIMFSDEIHCDLIRKNESFVSALNLPHGDYVIVATAVNKTFNLAGLQITNLIIEDKNMREKLNAYTGKILISPFSMEATIAAYNQGEEWLKNVNDIIEENADYISQFIKDNLPRIKYNKPQGTYLIWLDFSDYKYRGQELLEKIAEEAHLILESGSMFGNVGEGFIRMNIATPTNTVKEAMERLYKVFG